MKKPIVIVSAINIFEGGTLTVLKKCLRCLDNEIYQKYRIEVFVHKSSLFDQENFKNLSIIELPASRKNWLYRLYYEYFYFNKVSKNLRPYMWLSMHDTSPILSGTEKQCVYCHNPSIFHKTKLSTLIHDRTHFLFTLFYRFLYQINIQNNTFIIVQQNWIREKFIEKFRLDPSKVLVAYPETESVEPSSFELKGKGSEVETTFFYPAFPRTFKNFEVIIHAAKLLNKSGVKNFRVILTISGTENSYARQIQKLCLSVPNVSLIGKISQLQVQEMYKSTDVLIFPSTLETWGLPISEFKSFNKPILVADLPYAYETLGYYDKVMLFSPDDYSELAKQMLLFISKTENIAFQTTQKILPSQPHTSSWDEMLQLILKN